MNDIRNRWGLGNYIFSKEAEERLNKLSPMEYQHIILFLRKLAALGHLNRYQTLPNGLLEIAVDHSDYRFGAKVSGNKIHIFKFYKKGESEPGDTSGAVGLIGGALLGAAIGGPPGAIVGGILGALLGKNEKGVG